MDDRAGAMGRPFIIQNEGRNKNKISKLILHLCSISLIYDEAYIFIFNYNNIFFHEWFFTI